MEKFWSKISGILFRPVFMARLLFVLLATLIPFFFADPPQNPVVFSSAGFLGALIFVLFEYSTKTVSSRKLLMAVLGCLAGLIFSLLIYPTIPTKVLDAEVARFVCNMTFGYFGIVLALRHADWLRPDGTKFFLVNPVDKPKILDSSVIIDGRITGVIDMGLLSGPILVPNFVLLEVQGIADSSDPYRRARGKRGLEILDRLRRTCKTLDVIDTDFPEEPEVDQKLILLCRQMNGHLITNDFNLHKVAEMHQIEVLNINALADSLRPAVYVGELMNLMIVKEGRERGQGVGYLEDGTMIVVDSAAGLKGQETQVVVSNILQNPTGRLIFARLIEQNRGAPARLTRPEPGGDAGGAPAEA